MELRRLADLLDVGEIQAEPFSEGDGALGDRRPVAVEVEVVLAEGGDEHRGALARRGAPAALLGIHALIGQPEQVGGRGGVARAAGPSRPRRRR